MLSPYVEQNGNAAFDMDRAMQRCVHVLLSFFFFVFFFPVDKVERNVTEITH